MRDKSAIVRYLLQSKLNTTRALQQLERTIASLREGNISSIHPLLAAGGDPRRASLRAEKWSPTSSEICPG